MDFRNGLFCALKLYSQFKGVYYSTQCIIVIDLASKSSIPSRVPRQVYHDVSCPGPWGSFQGPNPMPALLSKDCFGEACSYAVTFKGGSVAAVDVRC